MAAASIVKQCLQVVPFVLIGCAAYFQARGVARLLGSVIRSAGDLSSSLQSTLPAPPVAPPGQPASAILTRHPFDSSTGALAGRPALGIDGSDPLSWPVCDGIQVVIVTESTDPWWSLTTLRESGTVGSRLRRVGDAVAGKQVAFIGFNPRQQAPSVWLEGSGTFCQAMLQQAPPALAATAPSNIKRLSDSDVLVDRSVVDKALEDPSALMRSVRVVPERKGGTIVGVRLLGIRPGSLLGTVGIRNGDRLESINGFSLASPEQALQAYARLRTASRLNVRLERLGKPVELTLTIN